MGGASARVIVRALDHDLAELSDRILRMGGWVERAIRDAIRALIECDEPLAKLTVERDAEINRMEIETDRFARTTIIRRQPVGSDLRAIMGALKIVTDLERIGDLSVEICEQTLSMDVRTHKFEDYLEVMADHVRRQVTQALDAYSSHDHKRALTVIDLDQHVDTLCRNYERNMLTVIMEDQSLITPALALMNIAQALERISDHATNICEMVIYIHLGHDIRHVGQEEALKMLDLKEGEWTPPTSW